MANCMAAQPPCFVIFRRYSPSTDKPCPLALAVDGSCSDTLAEEYYPDLTAKDIARFEG
jgi:hypothetical protein